LNPNDHQSYITLDWVHGIQPKDADVVVDTMANYESFKDRLECGTSLPRDKRVSIVMWSV